MSYTRSANVFVMGSAGVGKTELVRQLLNPGAAFLETTLPTLGCEFAEKNYKKDEVKIKVIDASGQEKFRANYRHYLEDSHIVLCCFDVSSDVSFNEATEMLKTALGDSSHCPRIIFVGTKADLLENDPNVIKDKIRNKIHKLDKIISEKVTDLFLTSAKQRSEGVKLDNFSSETNFLFNSLPGYCNQELELQRNNGANGAVYIPLYDDAPEPTTRTRMATYFREHPNVRMGLAIAGLVIGLAAIALATVATCGVAGLLGVAAASVAATLTFGASLTTVGAVAGGVGLFGGLSVAGGAYLMHTRPRAEVVKNNGSPFGGENSGEASDEATQPESRYTLSDLKWAIKEHRAVRFFAGVIKRAGECFQLPGSRPL